MRRLIIAAGVACTVIFGLTGAALAAQRGAAANPPPPVEAQPYAYKQWANAYLLQGDFRLSGFLDDRALLLDPTTITVEGAMLNALVRSELFRPERTQGAVRRSFRGHWAFDCEARKTRVLSSEALPQSNLQGRAVPLDVSGENWRAVSKDGGDAHLLDQVCSMGSLLRGGVNLAKAMPPDLDGVTAEATAGWMRDHIDLGQEVMIQADKGVGIFFTPSAVGKAPSGRPQLWLHTELSVLLASEKTMWRSMRDLVEIDCLNTRHLRTKQEVYPGSNLLGAMTAEELEPYWIDAMAGGSDARWIGALCGKLSNIPKAEPPAPADKSTEAVAEWIKSYINTNHYIPAVDIGEGVILYSTADLEALDNGHLVTKVRLEDYQPSETRPYRSMIQEIEFDCKGSRERTLSAIGYALSNLEGATVEMATPDWAKIGADTKGAILMRHVCSQASLAGAVAPVAMPSPLRGTTDAEILEWIDAHIAADGYEVASYAEQGAAMFSRQAIEPTRQGYMRATIRMEFFKPQITDDGIQRSNRMLMEFDCEQHRSRTLTTERFVGSNLIGDKIEKKEADPEWSFISPNTLLSDVANDVCDIAEENAEAADPANSQPSPAGQKL